jgi:uncharacterized protein (DUF2267 family)
MPVTYEDFIHIVEEEGGIPEDDARNAVRATLVTLGERLSGGEARDIAEQLPSEIRPLLTLDGEESQGFGVDEFLRRVAEREHVLEPAAEQHAAAVFAALGRVVSQDEIDDMAAELGRRYGTLLEAAKSPPRPRERALVPVSELVARVAARAGLEEGAARRALEAVLEALAHRIASGEVDDLAERLPAELHPALRRGVAKSAKAVPLSLHEFLREIADAEGGGATEDDAVAHARAAFAVLRDAVGEKELSDVVAELPREYDVLLEPPASSTAGSAPD